MINILSNGTGKGMRAFHEDGTEITNIVSMTFSDIASGGPFTVKIELCVGRIDIVKPVGEEK